MAEDKTRFRFRKEAALRLLGHHDLARTIERLLRRADLPFDSTGGFHPRPRIVFPLSLPLGVNGTDEIVEIEWKTRVDPVETLNQLNRCSLPGLAFASARPIPVKLTAKPRRVEYELPVPDSDLARARYGVEEARALPEMWVERTRPRHKRIDIRPYVGDVGIRGDRLWMSLWVTNLGTAKADEVCRMAGLDHLLDEGVWTRSRMEVYDELTPEEIARTPVIEAREEILQNRPTPAPETEVAASASWGASSDGPVTE